MLRVLSACVVGLTALLPSQTLADTCSPSALGTARTLALSAAYGPVGRVNYPQSLPLERGEVVLTFDDGPLPRRTEAVLQALRQECVKATFFVVGTMVSAFPGLLRRTAAEGHTIATHTWSHRYLNRVSETGSHRDQINAGLLAARAALGDEHPNLSPFFRFPGLGTTRALNQYVVDQHLVPFSIDVDGSDWKRISPSQVLERVLSGLEKRGKGIILLHDIQERTVAILPELLRQLKVRGYRVVHVVPDTGDTSLALAAAEMPSDRRMRVALARLEEARPVTAVASVEPLPKSPVWVGPPVSGLKPVQMAMVDAQSWSLRTLASTDEPLPMRTNHTERTLTAYRVAVSNQVLARTPAAAADAASFGLGRRNTNDVHVSSGRGSPPPIAYASVEAGGLATGQPKAGLETPNAAAVVTQPSKTLRDTVITQVPASAEPATALLGAISREASAVQPASGLANEYLRERAPQLAHVGQNLRSESERVAAGPVGRSAQKPASETPKASTSASRGFVTITLAEGTSRGFTEISLTR